MLPNVILMAGHKFGTTDAPARTWAMNTMLPGWSPRPSRSRIVAFSTGNVYPFVPVAPAARPRTSRSCRRPASTRRAASAASACSSMVAGTRGTPGLIFRLNYAIDLRYGVLHDVGAQGARRRAGRRDDGLRQRDLAGRRQRDGAALPAPLRHADRAAERHGAGDGVGAGDRPRLRRALRHGATIVGEEAPTALLSDASRALALFGPPTVGLDTLVAWQAEWLARGLPTLAKPTGFERREAPTDVDGAPLDALREADLDDALALSAEAGWNQDAADWRLMLRAGSAFAIRDGERVVATALALPYAPALGWVSMVLVHGPYRRRGLATRLVERATATLTGAGVLPVLDATPAERRCTRRMGYRPVEWLERWRGTSSGTARGDGSDGPRGARERAGPRRRSAPTAVPSSPTSRPGRRRSRSSTPAAPATCSRAPAGRDPARPAGGARRRDGDRAADARPRRGRRDGRRRRAGSRRPVTEGLAGLGFAPERPFIRMAFERDAIPGDAGLVHAIAGPELG